MKQVTQHPGDEKQTAKPLVRQPSVSDTKTASQNDVAFGATGLKRNNKDKSAKAIIDTLNTILSRVISRERSYHLNITEAYKSNAPAFAANVKPPFVIRLRILEGKSHFDTPLAGIVTFDSSNNQVAFLNRLKGSGANMNASMLVNKTGLVINVSEPVPARITQQPIAVTNDHTLARNSTILLLFIAGLGCIIGISTYLQGIAMIEKSKVSHTRNHLQAGERKPSTQTAGNPVRRIPHAGKEPGPGYDRLSGSATPPVKQAPVAVPETATAAVAATLLTQNKYFFAEIMTTSGPRKKNMSEPGADKDLGEDVCGFTADGAEMFMYLLDGTSDLHCLRNPETRQEYFSSRLLAQSLANKLRLAFTANRKEALDTALLQAVEDVKADWLNIINNLPAAEKNLVKMNIENKSFPECASTLLFGRLSISGYAAIYRSGDSKMYMFADAGNNIRFEDTPLTRKNEQSNDRIFFRLVMNANRDFDILYNKPAFEIVKRENIHTLVLFSDGIGTITEEVLQQQYAADSEAVRKEVMYQTQGTADDKSICFISIKKTGNT